METVEIKRPETKEEAIKESIRLMHQFLITLSELEDAYFQAVQNAERDLSTAQHAVWWSILHPVTETILAMGYSHDKQTKKDKKKIYP